MFDIGFTRFSVNTWISLTAPADKKFTEPGAATPELPLWTL